jgi:hypothetical protein
MQFEDCDYCTQCHESELTHMLAFPGSLLRTIWIRFQIKHISTSSSQGEPSVEAMLLCRVVDHVAVIRLPGPDGFE